MAIIIKRYRVRITSSVRPARTVPPTPSGLGGLGRAESRPAAHRRHRVQATTAAELARFQKQPSVQRLHALLKALPPEES